jgi:hypothetical protein
MQMSLIFFNSVVPSKKNSKCLQNIFGDFWQNKLYLKKIDVQELRLIYEGLTCFDCPVF